MNERKITTRDTLDEQYNSKMHKRKHKHQQTTMQTQRRLMHDQWTIPHELDRGSPIYLCKEGLPQLNNQI